MDLLETWKKLEKDKLNKPVWGVTRLPARSNHLVAKLRRSYLVKIGFSVAFLLISFVLVFCFDDTYIQIGMAIVTFSYVVFLLSAVVTFGKIKADLPVDGSLKEALAYTVAVIETNLKFEERAALVVYPFAVSSGFLMGLTTAGDSASRVFSEAFFGMALLLSIGVLTPLCYLLARWMHKVTYGKCLSEMKMMITDLQSE